MKTIDELKRLYREIIDLNEQKKRLVRQFVVELFNTDGYEVLLNVNFIKIVLLIIFLKIQVQSYMPMKYTFWVVTMIWFYLSRFYLLLKSK